MWSEAWGCRAEHSLNMYLFREERKRAPPRKISGSILHHSLRETVSAWRPAALPWVSSKSWGLMSIVLWSSERIYKLFVKEEFSILSWLLFHLWCSSEAEILHSIPIPQCILCISSCLSSSHKASNTSTSTAVLSSSATCTGALRV